MKRALLTLLFCSSAVQAQSLNASGVQRLNQDIVSLWTRDGLPMARTAAAAAAQKLVGVPHAINSKTTATITKINALTLGIDAVPGVRRLDAGGMDIALPLSGSWSALVDAQVHVKGRVVFISVDQSFSVKLQLTGITADLSAAFDSSDPSAPKVVAVHAPVVHFNLKITSSNLLVDMLGFLGSGLVDGIGQDLVVVAANVLAAKLDLMVKDTPSVENAGGPALAAFPRADLENAVAKLGTEIETERTPFGPVLEMHFDTGYAGTWGQSVADPAFNPGHPDAPGSYGDSGEMTGHYLAALAFQYASTHDATAKTRARRALATLRTLLTMRGEPGNMNRSIMPIWYLPQWMRPKPGYTPGEDYAAPWNGDLYYFTDYTSRDEYMGLFYGLSIAHDLFADDPAMQADAQQQIEMALDYLVRNGWTWRRRDGSYGERWAGVFEEQYAWVLAAWHGNPAKYQSLHDQYQGFTDILWTGFWTSAIDPYDSYYKFQLGAGALYALLVHETNPAAWMRAYQSVAILRHYIGHHLNAHFNNTYLAFDAASRPRLGAENTNLLSRWLSWPRRRQRVDLHGDPTIEKILFTPPFQPGNLYPQGNIPPTEIARYPLPPDQRIGSGFMWSVSPCQLDPGYPANPDSNREGETLDFVLPYWMARYYGAVVPPRMGPPTQ